jgi:hypothetical protein
VKYYNNKKPKYKRKYKRGYVRKVRKKRNLAGDNATVLLNTPNTKPFP